MTTSAVLSVAPTSPTARNTKPISFSVSMAAGCSVAVICVLLVSLGS